MKPGFEISAHKIFGYLRNQIPTAMAVSIPKTTPEQKAIGKKVRQNLYGQIKSEKRHGGITFVGPKGVGKTRMVGEVHSKAPKDEKTLNLFATCKTDHAEKQATEVRVTVGCKPLTLGRLPSVKTALKSSASATFTITPTSFGNLLNPNHALHEKGIATLEDSGVTCIRLSIDEAHKAYAGSSNKPARIAAWRAALAEKGIALVVTAVTATPLWDQKSKAQGALAKRACTVLGLEVGEGETAVGVLNENIVTVSPEESAAIFAETKSLQTAAPDKFERREQAIPGGFERSSELAAHIADARPLLLGLALDGPQGHIDRLNGLKVCTSMAVVQKVLDTYAIEGALPEKGAHCKTVVKAADGKLSLSEEMTLVRSNAILVVDTPEARKYLVEQLTDRAENEDDARAMEFFDFTTKDRATFNANLAGFHAATTRMTSGHPIGIIEPSQLEGSNEFGKNVFAILAIGDFPLHLLNQGAGRLARPVPLEAGDLVPVDGYNAVHLASKWQPAVRGALKAKTSHSKPLPEAVNKLLTEYEAERKDELEELFGEDEEDEADTVYERVVTTAKQLVKLDAARRLCLCDLATTYLGAVLDEEKKEELLAEAFGKKLGDEGGAKRDRTGSVLAEYASVSAVASDEEKEDEVMAGAEDAEASDSDDE
jgi:hypothetical protein